jgi:hypothetical protein
MLAKLDSSLLRAAQWVVDKIGGDYIGQRIGRQAGYVGALGSMTFLICDYRMQGGLLAWVCFMWAINLFYVHFIARKAMQALHKGFINPLTEDYSTLLLFAIFSPINFVLIHRDWTDLGYDVAYVVFALGLYFIATDNPPPKKAEQKDEVSLLTPAPQQP